MSPHPKTGTGRDTTHRRWKRIYGHLRSIANEEKSGKVQAVVMGHSLTVFSAYYRTLSRLTGHESDAARRAKHIDEAARLSALMSGPSCEHAMQRWNKKRTFLHPTGTGEHSTLPACFCTHAGGSMMVHGTRASGIVVRGLKAHTAHPKEPATAQPVADVSAGDLSGCMLALAQAVKSEPESFSLHHAAQRLQRRPSCRSPYRKGAKHQPELPAQHAG